VEGHAEELGEGGVEGPRLGAGLMCPKPWSTFSESHGFCRTCCGAVFERGPPAGSEATEAVWDVYRLRWAVETFFKTAESGCALGELPNKDRHRVEALVCAALIRALIRAHMSDRQLWRPLSDPNAKRIPTR
jgi:hypothetical protein